MDLSPVAAAPERAPPRPAALRGDAEAPLELRRLRDPVPRQRHHRGDQPRQVLRVPLRRQAGRRARADGAAALRDISYLARGPRRVPGAAFARARRAGGRPAPRRAPPGRRGERLGAPLRGDRRGPVRGAPARLGRRRDLRRPGADQGLPRSRSLRRDLAAARGHRRRQRLVRRHARATCARRRHADPRVRTILNAENRGFAAANNQGIAAVARRGRRAPQQRHGRAAGPHRPARRATSSGTPPSASCVRRRTSAATRPASSPTTPTSRASRPSPRAAPREHRGSVFDIGVAAMYCVATRRAVLDDVGPLDEAYGDRHVRGRRLRRPHAREGYRVACAEDAYVHHVGQGAFRKLSPRPTTRSGRRTRPTSRRSSASSGRRTRRARAWRRWRRRWEKTPS